MIGWWASGLLLCHLKATIIIWVISFRSQPRVRCTKYREVGSLSPNRRSLAAAEALQPPALMPTDATRWFHHPKKSLLFPSNRADLRLKMGAWAGQETFVDPQKSGWVRKDLNFNSLRTGAAMCCSRVMHNNFNEFWGVEFFLPLYCPAGWWWCFSFEKKGDKVIYQWKRQLNQCEQLTNGTWYPVRCTFWFGGCHPPTNNKKTLGENVCTTFESYDVSSPSLLGVCTTTYNKSVVRIKWLMVSDQFWVLFSTNRSNSSCCRSSRAIVVFSISHFFLVILLWWDGANRAWNRGEDGEEKLQR